MGSLLGFRLNTSHMLKALAIKAYFKWKGPPRILSFDADINAAVLVQFGAHVGEKVTVYGPVVLHAAESGFHNLSLAGGCTLEGGTFFDLTERVSLGRGVTVSADVTIMTHNNYNGNEFQERVLAHTSGAREVRIGSGAFIGARSVVLMGITIGSNAVIQAGSVVNRDIPENCTAGGIPARVIRMFGESGISHEDSG